MVIKNNPLINKLRTSALAIHSSKSLIDNVKSLMILQIGVTNFKIMSTKEKHTTRFHISTLLARNRYRNASVKVKISPIDQRLENSTV